jgi:hypothetical protein
MLEGGAAAPQGFAATVSLQQLRQWAFARIRTASFNQWAAFMNILMGRYCLQSNLGLC